MKQTWRIKRTTILTIALGAFLFGLIAARKLPFVSVYFLASGFLLMNSGMMWRRSKRPFVICSVLFMFMCGWWRGSVYMQKVATYQNFYYQALTIEAVAQDDSIYSERRQLTFRVGDVKVTEPQSAELVGEIEIEGFGTGMVYRGDTIRAQGKLYPRRGSLQAGISFAEVKIVSRDQSKINTIRRNFAVGLQNTLPEPLASFALGLLIGQRSGLGQELSDQLTNVGLIHIVAVSGYNLTVLTHLSQRVFAKRSRYQALIASLALIACFLLFTGYSASIVRAAIVSLLGLLTWFYGRRVRPVLLIIMTAAITAGVHPLYIWGNIGWYLSFAAFFGVLVLAPLARARFIKKQNREKLLQTLLSETIAAQMCTLPIILYIFGRLSTIGVIANILVVPLVPFAMMASFMAGMAGMFKIAIADFLALPAKLSLEYMLDTAGLLSNVPYGNVQFKIDWSGIAVLYAGLIIFTCLLWRKVSEDATITDEKKEL